MVALIVVGGITLWGLGLATFAFLRGRALGHREGHECAAQNVDDYLNASSPQEEDSQCPTVN